ncbi:MAG: tRNA (guanine-N1)-methyltransferase [uncultured bacterium]|nr:MAG: tRNA (guanine-N1)-methyltransferase [uncultured bacterium]
MKKFYIISLFPDFIQSFKNHSMIYRAEKNKVIKIIPIDLRKFGISKRKTVDGNSVGGGGGMLLRVDVIINAIDSVKKKDKKTIVILLDPKGKTFVQSDAIKYSKIKSNIILVCGHYEGVDDRVNDYIDYKVSIGNYVLTGGEMPAMVVVDAVSRNIKGFFGDKTPHLNDSFCIKFDNFKLNKNCKFKIENCYEYPQYTKPNEFEGKKIPEILFSGNHKIIDDWKHQQALKITKK